MRDAVSSSWRGPDAPAAWYFAAASRSLARGAVVSREVGGAPVAVFRTETGRVHAVDGHCAHMGASLGLGTVVGERLRCPLHHREYDATGRCAAARDGERHAIRAYATAETFGAVFVYAGAAPWLPVPSFEGFASDGIVARVARPVRLRCPWYVVAANGFDLHHLRVVHRRELCGEAVLDRPAPFALRLRYVSRVAGHGPADRVLRRLSSDSIRVTMTCWGGTVVLVESEIGWHRAALALCILPREDGVDVVPIVAVPRTRAPVVGSVKASIAKWLYTSFLERDVAILDRIRFRANLAFPEDDAFAACLAFLGELPRAGEGR